jgi:hypothetical protein
MNYQRAVDILEIPKHASPSVIKRMYYKKALKLHPDKEGTTEQFQELNEAYQFLQTHSEPNFVNILYDKSIVTILSTLDNTTLLSLYRFLLEYKEFIPDAILDTVSQYIQSKLTILLLEPTIDDLLEQKIYIYTHDNVKYTIPLWHHELNYDKFMVICKPKVTNIELDCDNNIYTTVHASLSDVFQRQKISFFIGKKEFIINASQLYIKPFQECTISSTIPTIHQQIYTNSYSTIYVSIFLN